jgi:hypothetical protein
MRLAHLLDHAADPTQTHNRDDRQQYQTEHHDEALHEIGPRHCQKPAHHRVQNNNRRADGNTHVMWHAKDRVKCFTDGGKLRPNIGHHARENNDYGNETKYVGFVVEMRFQIIGNGDGIGFVRMFA